MIFFWAVYAASALAHSVLLCPPSLSFSLSLLHTHQSHLQPFLVTHSQLTSSCSASVPISLEAFHEYLFWRQQVLFPG